MRVLVRLDDNPVIGRGHVVRTSALLALLKDASEVVVAGDSSSLSGWFPGAILEKVAANDFASIGMLAAEHQPDLFLCDHPNAPAHIYDVVREGCDVPCVAIDDKGGHVGADLIVNGTVIEELQRYEDLRPNAQLLAGPAYTLVRDEFRRNPWKPPQKRVLTIIVGSGQRAADWAMVLASGGAEFSVDQVIMIVSGSFPAFAELQPRCAERSITLRHGLTAAEMAAALAETTVALTTGGMIVYECVAAGVPAVVFPQEENLVEECAWLHEHGCVVSLGREGTSRGLVESACRGVLTNNAKQRALSEASRATIDGRGMLRVVQAIGQLVRRTSKVVH